MSSKTGTKTFSLAAAAVSLVTLGGIFLAGKERQLKRKKRGKKDFSWKKTFIWTIASGLISSFSKLLISETTSKTQKKLKKA
ncbi:hypothetical protein CHISP_3107 [Chitinispirillum alkaliphilum]|nr:hypothetical protein CHISP_3107 [Chitinispirillum alkaliphilum]